MEDRARAHIFVSGRVQGVFFRYSARSQAQKLGLTGFVRNLDDDRVIAVFEGEKEQIEKILDWAKRGSVFAKISNLEIKREEYNGEFKSFDIR